jgi:hypothetical protein
MRCTLTVITAGMTLLAPAFARGERSLDGKWDCDWDKNINARMCVPVKDCGPNDDACLRRQADRAAVGFSAYPPRLMCEGAVNAALNNNTISAEPGEQIVVVLPSPAKSSMTIFVRSSVSVRYILRPGVVRYREVPVTVRCDVGTSGVSKLTKLAENPDTLPPDPPGAGNGAANVDALFR